MVGAGHGAYTNRFHELARLVPHLVNPESRKIERYMYGPAPQIHRMVAATEPKTMQKAEERMREFGLNVPPTILTMHPKDLVATCFNSNRPGHLAKDCRGVPRNMNPVNARNPPGRACYECGCTDHV
nr:reverse transcriptase domain-containing protein [Tanacetum cinerariifolium]